METKPAGFSYQKWNYIDLQGEYDGSDALVDEVISTDCFEVATDASANSIFGTMIGGHSEAGDRVAEIAAECRSFLDKNLTNMRCIYCETNLVVHDAKSEDVFARSVIDTKELMFLRYTGSAAPTVDTQSQFEQQLATCPNCGWWKMVILHRCVLFNNNSERGERRYGWNTGKKGLMEDIRHRVLAYGKMKEFDIGAVDAQLDDLRAWLSKHPDHVSHVDPFRFEKLIANSLRAQGTYADVREVGGRGDRGIDILLIDHDDQSTLVQVKRRAGGAVETVDTVRALNGVLLREGIPHGMVITTAGRFTRPAIEETKIFKEGLYATYRVDLYNFEFVKNLLKTTYQNDPVPWRSPPNEFRKLLYWIERERDKHRKLRGKSA